MRRAGACHHASLLGASWPRESSAPTRRGDSGPAGRGLPQRTPFPLPPVRDDGDDPKQKNAGFWWWRCNRRCPTLFSPHVAAYLAGRVHRAGPPLTRIGSNSGFVLHLLQACHCNMTQASTGDVLNRSAWFYVRVRLLLGFNPCCTRVAPVMQRDTAVRRPPNCGLSSRVWQHPRPRLIPFDHTDAIP